MLGRSGDADAQSMTKLLSLRLLLSAVAVGGIMSVGAYGTFSSWTDTTSAQASTLKAGTVKLTNSDTGSSSLFSLTGLLPGASTTKCINVTNAGDVPLTNVGLSGSSSGQLVSALSVKIDRGTGAAGGTNGSCTGFSAIDAGIVDGLLSTLPGVSSPLVDSSTGAPGDTKSFKVTVSFAANAAAALQGKTADLGLTWTATS
jgi:predicted ribosomally synthesized peptide with SipW-like signal peptide